MGALTGPVRDGGFLLRVARGIQKIRSTLSLNSVDGWTIMQGNSPSEYERTGRNLRLLGFEKNPVVSACVRLIVDSIAVVKLEAVIPKKGGDIEVVPMDHPLQVLLDAPSIGWSGFRWRHTFAGHFVTYGNGFNALKRANGPNSLPASMRLIAPERIDYAYIDPTTEEISRYEWTNRLGVRQSTDWFDMIHLRDLQLTDGLFGFPRAAATLLDIATDGEASQYVRQVLMNDGSPRLIIGLKNVTDEKVAKATEERFQELSVQRGQRGRVRFMPNVDQVIQIGFNLRELEFPSLRQVTREDICAAFGVDPRLISVASAKGNEGGLSGQQYAEARRRLYQQTSIPIMEAMIAELNLSLAPEFGNVQIRFSPEALADVMEDQAETSTRVVTQLQAGVITREEARTQLGYEPKMNPKDTLVGTMARIEYPVALQFASSQPDPAVDPAVDPATGEPKPAADPNAMPAPAEPRALKTGPVVRSRVIKRGIVLTDDQKRGLWAAFDQRWTREETAYRRQALLLFGSERSDVRSIFAQATDAAKGRARRDGGDSFIDAALNAIRKNYEPGQRYHAAWMARYRALITQTFSTAGSDIAASAGVSFTLENPRFQSVINARTTKLANHVTQTTADQITAAAETGRSAGMSMSEIANLIDQTVFESQAPTRARTIAETEVGGAMNQAEFESATATGVIQSKAWLSQRDGDVRDSHQACDQQSWIPMEEAFSNGLMFPGDPTGPAEEVIKCRCAQLFSDEIASAAK